MTTSDELLGDIQNSFDVDVAKEIFDQYKKTGEQPSDAVIDAIGTIFGKARTKYERLLAFRPFER